MSARFAAKAALSLSLPLMPLLMPADNACVFAYLSLQVNAAAAAVGVLLSREVKAQAASPAYLREGSLRLKQSMERREPASAAERRQQDKAREATAATAAAT